MRALFRAFVVLCTVLAGVLVGARPALADPISPGAIGYSSGAQVGGGSVVPTVQLSGSLAGLLGWLIDPLMAGAVSPLVAALQTPVKGVVDGLLGASSSNKATNPADMSSPGPAGSFPSDMPGSQPVPCEASSATRPCYNAVSVVATASPLLSVSSGAVRGFTQQVTVGADSTNPIFGRASISDLSIDALGLDVITASQIDAKATCPNAGTDPPSAMISASSVNVLGLVGISVSSSTGLMSVTVNSTTSALKDLPVTVVGAVTVQKFGSSAVKVSIPIGLAEVVDALGLSSPLITSLLTYAPVNASFTLSVIIGANSVLTDDTASAWGLGVGIDLSGSVALDLGLGVGLTIAIPTGITSTQYGNLLDLKLGYATCKKGSAPTSTGTPFIPRGLT